MNMKKILTAFILISLIFILTPAVFAENEDFVSMVHDYAGLLTVGESEHLNAKAAEISAKYQCSVAIVTVDDMYGFDAKYAYDDRDAYVLNKYLYNELGLGYGEEGSCLLLCLSMAERDYWLEPYGYAETAFTIHGVDVMLDRHVLPLLGENKYYAAFNAYLDKAEEYLSMSRDGKPFDKNTDPEVIRQKILNIAVISLSVSLLVAFGVCQYWKSQMKSAVPARQADQYIPKNGFNLTGREDKFLYSTETRSKIEKSSSRGSGSSRSSAGRGGKF